MSAAPATPSVSTRKPSRPIDLRDLTPMILVLAQLRGRSLSVAAAKFADQLVVRLNREAV
ncbi:hypothetical protein ACRBEV_22145 [Methylobacterium phyllosphaerae]